MILMGASYANFGRRLAANFLDCVVLTLVLLLVGITLHVFRVIGNLGATPGWSHAGGSEKLWGLNAKLFVVFGFALSMGPVYFVLCEVSPRQTTFGKHLLNIYVTSDAGKRISVSRAAGRWVAKFILSWFALNLVSIITILATKERKGLHDGIAKTLVLRGRRVPGGALDPWRIAAALGFQFVWMLGTFLAIF